MTESSLPDDITIQQLTNREAERCRAISQGDWPALEAVLHGDFLYGFLSGRIEDKVTYLTGLPGRPHGITSSHHRIRLYGETAVMVSDFISTNTETGAVANEGTALGVWLKQEATWKIVAYHSTRTGPAPA